MYLLIFYQKRTKYIVGIYYFVKSPQIRTCSCRFTNTALMKRRQFVQAGTLFTLGAMTSSLAACDTGASGTEDTTAGKAEKAATKTFTLPELPYAHNALAPYIDEQTMQIHHGKHHAGYVRKLNAALEGHAMAGKNLAEIVQSVTDKDTGVRNNGGGHFNHSLFWEVMQPGGGEVPAGKLADAINSTFTSFDGFKEQFAKAAATRFGSGWAWLSVGEDGKLFVSSTPNQDNPMMKNIVEQAGAPLLGLDVWEHAYYLNYQNRRKDYIDSFFKIINWEAIAKNYTNLG